MLRKVAYTISLLLILCTPFIYSDVLYNGVISAKQFWFYGAMAILMLIAGLDILLSEKSSAIKLNAIDIALLAFYTYYLFRAATTPYMPLLHNQRFINWTLLMVMYFIVKHVILFDSLSLGSHSLGKTTMNDSLQMTTKDEHSYKEALHLTISNFIISFLILTGLGQAIWGLLQLYGYLPSFNSNFRITGTFFNPAPYALYLAVIFPLALGRIIKNEELKIKNIERCGNGFASYIKYFCALFILNFSFLIYWLSFATVIAILLVLPATMIRAAWLGALVGALVALQYKYHYIQSIQQFLHSKSRKIMTGIVTLSIIALLGIGAYHLKKDSANGKLFIWEVTLGKIVDKPWFGYGVGRFEAEYNNWQAEWFQKHPKEKDGPKGWVAGNTKYCFNEFLEMTSETGIIGLGLVITLIGTLFYKLIVSEELKTISSLLIIHCSFLAILTLSFISYPFYNISLILLLFLLLGSLSSNIENKYSIQVYKPIKAFVAITFIVFFITISHTQYNKIKSYINWQQASIAYETGSYTDANNIYKSNLQLLKYEGLYLQQYGKSLQITGQNFLALDILTQARLLTTDHVLYCTFGDAYKAIKETDKAEQCYLYASAMKPNIIYPHYLLAKLYHENGNKKKAFVKANDVLNKSTKIRSVAVEEMRVEMNEMKE